MNSFQVYEEMRLMLLRMYNAGKMTWTTYYETVTSMNEALKFKLSQTPKEKHRE